jgi:short-subunit dehydrogenase
MKTFLSIGSGPGIGLATAQRFAWEGYRIVLSSRNMERLRKQAALLSADGTNVTLIEADATKPGQIVDLVNRARTSDDDELVVHYNTGVLHYDADGKLLPQAIQQQNTAELSSDLQANLGSALVAIKTALPGMQKQGGGTILLTGGGFGIHPSPDFLTLSVGKAGLRATAQALFEPLRKDNIHIATVTVSQLVSPDSDASRTIAELFWQLHSEQRDNWSWERQFG